MEEITETKILLTAGVLRILTLERLKVAEIEAKVWIRQAWSVEIDVKV